MNRLVRYAKPCLALAILGGLLLLPYLVVVAPIRDAYRSAREELAEAHARLDRAVVVAGRVDRLRARLAALGKGKRNRGEFLQAANDSLAAAQLQNRLKQFIDAARGELRSTQILQAKKEGNLTRVALRVQMSGTVASVQRVLYAVESFSPRLFVDNLDIRARPHPRGAGGRDEVLLDVRFDTFGYMRGAPA